MGFVRRLDSGTLRMQTRIVIGRRIVKDWARISNALPGSSLAIPIVKGKPAANKVPIKTKLSRLAVIVLRWS